MYLYVYASDYRDTYIYEYIHNSLMITFSYGIQLFPLFSLLNIKNVLIVSNNVDFDETKYARKLLYY